MTLVGGNVVVPAGVASFTVSVPTLTDCINEQSPESFTLSVGGVAGTGNITDTNTPAITHVGDTDPAINSVTVPEGTAAVFTVNLSTAPFADTAFALNLASGSATLGADFTSGLSFSNGVTLVGGNVVVPAGVASFTVSVPTLTDSINEQSPESFTLSVGGVAGTGNITDTNTPAITHVGDTDPAIDSVTVPEGTAAVFTVNLSTAPFADTAFALNLASGSATLGADFTSGLSFSNGVTLVGGNVVVPAGVASFTVSVPTLTDSSMSRARSPLPCPSAASPGPAISPIPIPRPLPMSAIPVRHR